MTVRRFLVGLLAIAALLGAAQLALQHYASVWLQRTLAQADGWARIRVGAAHFWLWGEADLNKLTITPGAWYAASYGLPLGYTVVIDRVRIHRLRPRLDGGLSLVSADADFDGVHLPLPDWNWTVTVAHGANGRRLAAPTLADLGMQMLTFDSRLRVRFDEGLQQPRLLVHAALPDLARLAVDCSLTVAADALRAPDEVAVRRCRLRYDDAGLLSRFESRMAKDNHLSLPALQHAIAAQLALDAAQAHWPRPDTAAVRRLVTLDSGGRLELRIEPRQPLPLGKVPRGLWPGLPAYFGLTASVPTRPPSVGFDDVATR